MSLSNLFEWLRQSMGKQARDLGFDLFLHVLLGSFPLLINYFLVSLYESHWTLPKAAPSRELFFFCIFLSAATIFSLISSGMDDNLSGIGYFILGAAAVFSIVFYGIAARSSIHGEEDCILSIIALSLAVAVVVLSVFFRYRIYRLLRVDPRISIQPPSTDLRVIELVPPGEDIRVETVKADDDTKPNKR